MKASMAIIKEYGLIWPVNRLIYSLKLLILKKLPYLETLFEKQVTVRKIDIFNFDALKIKEFLKSLPEEKKTELITIADDAISGRIKGFSSVDLDYGNPIDWHYWPITGINISNKYKWYRIPDFAPERGDIKVIWEVSRFTHFLYFIRAFLLTEDKKYYVTFSKQLKHWLDSNVYSYGANYKCGQECTLRMINTLIAYSIFNSFGLITAEDRNNVICLVRDSYKKIISNFFYAHKCIKNNHTFSEICGHIIGAWCCQDQAKLIRSYKLFDEEVRSQFYSDGGYKQFSFNYQRFSLQIIECLLKISETTGISISSDSKKRIKDSVLLMYQCQDNNGKMPNYGSNDGSLVFPLTSCGYEDFRPVLNTAYSQIEGKRLFPEGIYDEELYWFSDTKPQIAPLERMDSGYEKSGFYTLRHHGGFIMLCLQDFKSRPAHMDQLHIDLWHKGVNVFCDSGTYSYASELGRKLSLTTAHNTAKVKGLEQMDKKGAFLVYNWTKRDNVTFKDGYFEGTMTSKKGYRHTRKVVKTTTGYVIDDHVAGKASKVEYLFHTPCDFTIESNRVKLFSEGMRICTLIAQEESKIEIKKVSRSLFYLKEETINLISIKKDLVGGEDKNITEIILEE